MVVVSATVWIKTKGFLCAYRNLEVFGAYCVQTSAIKDFRNWCFSFICHRFQVPSSAKSA